MDECLPAVFCLLGKDMVTDFVESDPNNQKLSNIKILSYK